MKRKHPFTKRDIAIRDYLAMPADDDEAARLIAAEAAKVRAGWTEKEARRREEAGSRVEYEFPVVVRLGTR